MEKNNIELVKKLREQTGVSIAQCQKALKESSGDIDGAIKILKTQGAKIAETKMNRKTEQGIISAYVHPNGKVAVIVEINCETDFVARNADFKNFCHEIALQIAAMNPENVEKLLKQPYIKDESQIVEQLLHLEISKTGENIQIKRFERFELGE